MTSRPFISPRLRRQVAKDANNRCGYCLSAEILMGSEFLRSEKVSGQQDGENKPCLSK